MQRVITHGQAAPATSSSLGSRQGLWPTITSHTPDMESNGPNGHSGTYLAGAVKCWATPNAEDAKAGMSTGRQQKTLGQDVSMETKQWGTPASNDANKTPHCEVNSKQAGLSKSVGLELQKNQTGKLNGQWVTQLMGLPMGWVTPSCPASVIRNWPRFVSGWLSATVASTNYDCLEMELFQTQQK
jgi:hypothetical protein